jgi:hypothetical protein
MILPKGSPARGKSEAFTWFGNVYILACAYRHKLHI